MNPPNFYGFKVEKDPQGFIDEVFKVLNAMGVSYKEKEELSAYQFKDVDGVSMSNGGIKGRLDKVGFPG